jgi:hypothetical protein
LEGISATGILNRHGLDMVFKGQMDTNHSRSG